MPPGQPTAVHLRGGGRLTPEVTRQENGEGGALARRALHGDVPAALLHDPVHRREAETGALAGLLGGEERLEDAGVMAGSMPTPVSRTSSAT